MNCLFILLLLCCCGGNKGAGCCVEDNRSRGCKEDTGCASVRQSRRCEDDVFEEKCDRVSNDCDCNDHHHEHCHEQMYARVNQWDYPRFNQGNVTGCNDNCGCEEESRGCDCIRK